MLIPNTFRNTLYAVVTVGCIFFVTCSLRLKVGLTASPSGVLDTGSEVGFIAEIEGGKQHGTILFRNSAGIQFGVSQNYEFVFGPTLVYSDHITATSPGVYTYSAEVRSGSDVMTITSDVAWADAIASVGTLIQPITGCSTTANQSLPVGSQHMWKIIRQKGSTGFHIDVEHVAGTNFNIVLEIYQSNGRFNHSDNTSGAGGGTESHIGAIQPPGQQHYVVYANIRDSGDDDGGTYFIRLCPE